jgi:2-pyrone-4,6-dicarboxylate lactonase
MDVEPISYRPEPSLPKFKMPRSACDAHVHVFGPRSRYPFADTRPSTPHDAPKDKLFAMHEMMGIARCVIVQSLTHGFDNSAVEDAIVEKGGAYLGVALLPTTVSDEELRRLDAIGFRGVRFSYIVGRLDAVEPIQDVIAFSKRLANIGWHLQMQLDGVFFKDMAADLKKSAVPVVIDHMGRVNASLGVDQPEFREVLALMDDRNFHIKVSGADRITRQGSPYRDALPFASKLVAEHGDRVVWGTDWPHPGYAGDNRPDDGVLVDLLAEAAPTERERQMVLVDNPQRFYGFKNAL